MKRFIELEYVGLRLTSTMYVDVDKIESIHPSFDKDYSYITMFSGAEHQVLGTPQEIMGKINQIGG